MSENNPTDNATDLRLCQVFTLVRCQDEAPRHDVEGGHRTSSIDSLGLGPSSRGYRLLANLLFDATSKWMPGVLVGTFSDYGDFDECLQVEAPRTRNREDGFRGSSCSVQFKPPYPQRSPTFTVVKGTFANDTDTLGGAFRVAYEMFNHKWFRLVACVPSKCSLQDMQLIAQKISNMTSFDIRIPKCYKKEDSELQSIHVAVLVSLMMLLTICIIGTVIDTQCQQQSNANEVAFSALGKAKNRREPCQESRVVDEPLVCCVLSRSSELNGKNVRERYHDRASNCVLPTDPGACASLRHEGDVEPLAQWRKVFQAFSLSSNLGRLLAPSGGSSELKCIHGVRALSMCWIILGHSYVLLNFDLLKSQKVMQNWFASWQFEFISNGWMAVEPFFLISGILMSYGGMKSIKRLSGFKNIPMMALRRYIRLTPPLLLMMGLVFFLPLVSSGPFWSEQVDDQLESCREYWWSTLLYVSNWLGIRKGCTGVTWYLAADFQLHIFSLFLLIVVIRHVKIGMSALFMGIVLSCITVGIQTIRFNLTPTAQLSTADDEKVYKVLDEVHILTLTHLSPYCVGMILGYSIHKYRKEKIKKWIVIIGWCSSVILSVSALLGCHRFSTGDESSRYAAILYASVHRTVFVVGVAWVIFACITGNGDFSVEGGTRPPRRVGRRSPTSLVLEAQPDENVQHVSEGLESDSRLNIQVYSYLANMMTTFALTVPFCLILEAPLTHVDRIIFSHNQEKTTQQDNNLSPEKLNWNPQKDVSENVITRARILMTKKISTNALKKGKKCP
ncbi:O-acyltransferase like protein-like [Parasteatoda tepidariorum]|uniref:O-acyltransferase like protein-like n=1 Tax=Parasteatoda tepidariorum TaxID=114398 RepID=UPI0039BCBA92